VENLDQNFDFRSLLKYPKAYFLSFGDLNKAFSAADARYLKNDLRRC